MKTAIIIVALVMFSLFNSVALAHVSNTSSPQYQMMQRMMGQDPLEVYTELEEGMMGDEAQERMDQLMNKMLEGSLTAQEQKEMTEILKNSAYGVGPQMVMMRGIMGQMMTNFAGRTSGLGMMGGMGGTGGWWNLSWVTLILLWVLMGLGIAGLVKFLKAK